MEASQSVVVAVAMAVTCDPLLGCSGWEVREATAAELSRDGA